MSGNIEAQPIRSELIGIGALLAKYLMEVPEYQRPYSWNREHAKRMFDDFALCISKRDEEDYFLGTVVLTRNPGGYYSIVDGQQRLVTTTVLFSAIRNYFLSKETEDSGNQERASIISKKYLSDQDFTTLEHKCRLLLAPEDRDIFLQLVIEDNKKPKSLPDHLTETQKRIQGVTLEAENFIEEFVAEQGDPIEALNSLRVFIESHAKIVCLDVSSDTNAYIIFEVLNDRGLDLSITDLLKNHVFSTCNDSQLKQCQDYWAKMRNSIMSEYDENEIKDFIRQSWIADHGLVRHRALYNAIKENIKKGSDSLKYTKSLAARAEIFSALKNSDSTKWQKYDEEVRKALKFFVLSGATQIRPLVIAIFENFREKEVNRAIPMIACWVVRHLIVGAVGSSQLEVNYASLSSLVTNKTATNADALYSSFRAHSSDADFKDAFRKANVSKGALARWYLKELEMQETINKNSGKIEKVVNIDVKKINLEHIMPKVRNPEWPINLDDDEYNRTVRRLGNQVLMDSKDNSRLGNGSWQDKKKKLEVSDIILTKEASENASWTPKEIDARQERLAEIALQRWPNKPK